MLFLFTVYWPQVIVWILGKTESKRRRGLQRVRHDLVTEQQLTIRNKFLICPGREGFIYEEHK